MLYVDEQTLHALQHAVQELQQWRAHLHHTFCGPVDQGLQFLDVAIGAFERHLTHTTQQMERRLVQICDAQRRHEERLVLLEQQGSTHDIFEEAQAILRQARQP
jgi:hypothetical protein